MERWEERLNKIEVLIAETAKMAAAREKEREKERAEEKERVARIDALAERTFKGLEELKTQTGDINSRVEGIGDSNGKFSETYFYNTLLNSMRFGDTDFDEIDKGLKRAKKMPNGEKIKGEYDVIMYNGDIIALIEIKYKVRKGDCEKLIGKQISDFKILFPQYANRSFYLGIAGLSFEDGAEAEALSKGVGILRPKGESVEVLDQNLKAF